ncbi:MAG: thiolase family protein [Alphaproteobacteria bacterium]|nr:thiolase family protein [Alphaproteobacteria bacterium]MCB9690457.1 thiolase family protein [Alphaproteobacteria bacterium]
MREVAVVSAVRSAIGKAKKGSLKDTRPDDLLAAVLKGAVERAGIDPAEIDDVVVGTAMPEAEQGMNVARISAIMAGIPDTVPALTINRFCSSGIQAIAQGATSILSGWQDVVLAGGVESMTQIAMGGQKPSPNPHLMDERPDAYTPMGITAENVAERFGVSRADQDAFSAASNDKALAAIEAGRFKEEILPVPVRVFEDGAWVERTFDTDEGPRASTVEGLGKLKTPFKATGSVTAGSSSQMSDGAAAAVIMDRAKAEARGLPILGVLRSYQVVGVPPDIMGVGPLYAIPKAVEAAGLTLDDIDVFEINEAFASQALYCVRELGIDPTKVNPNGGAIALGHPLGATGARMTATLLHEMKRRNARYGIVSMCIGGGMGAAAVFENIHAD